MTIKADWMHIWKAENGAAFTPKCAHDVNVVFIDGQIKLMKAHSIKTWKELCYWNFASMVKKHFQAGATTVVMAFDDYSLVPMAKNMTQTKRVRHVPPMTVHKNQTLPAAIPENWSECIMNRAFKTKVIKLVVETLPKLVPLLPGQSLIIDYQGHPILHTVDEEPRILTDLVPLGEADVKFARYASAGKMLVEATDGDYIPIALLHLEKCIREGVEPPLISIHRMSININGPKRTAAGDVKYTYEHLNVNKLFQYLQKTVILKLGHRADRLGNTAGWQMHVISALISYTGCDFSKGLPYISPKRIWDNLGLVWGNMEQAFDRDQGKMNVPLVTDKVIARLYCVAYNKHVARERQGMADVAERLKTKSALSQTVRGRLPDEVNVTCVVRNGNWVLAYWTSPETCPAPFDGDFGFTFDKKGRPVWEDDLRA